MKLILIYFLLLLPLHLQAKEISKDKRENSTFTGTLKLSPLAFGAEVGYHVSPDTVVGVNWDIDHLVVIAWSSQTLYTKFFFGNSFFTKLGAGYFKANSDFDESQGKGINFIIGNEWIKNNGFVIGADWIGQSIYYKENSSSEDKNKWAKILHLPKFRIGYAF